MLLAWEGGISQMLVGSGRGAQEQIKHNAFYLGEKYVEASNTEQPVDIYHDYSLIIC